MTCDELEAFLHPYLDGEFEPQERLELEAHLAACPPCARTLHEEARFREAFRQRMRAGMEGAAPASLRARVQSSLLEAQRQQRRTLLTRSAAAAVVVLAAGGTYIGFRPLASRAYVEDAARRHARPLPPEIQPGTHEAVEQWLDGKLEHRVAVPRFPNLQVRSARIANVKDRTAAYVTYEASPPTPGEAVSASGSPSEGAQASAGPPASAAPRRVGLFFFSDTEDRVGARPLPRVEVDSSHGYNVAIWRDGEVVYELVSDLDEADIRRMVAEGAAGPARTAPPRPVRPEVEVRAVSAPAP
jgi:mycothiol system anti-sigma-R factor